MYGVTMYDVQGTFVLSSHKRGLELPRRMCDRNNCQSFSVCIIR